MRRSAASQTPTWHSRTSCNLANVLLLLLLLQCC
jgi:hypothetical protein